MGYAIPVTLATLSVVVLVLSVLYLNTGPTVDPAAVQGKRVLITGASSGLGAKLAQQYARYGASLVIAGRRQEQLLAVAEQCRKLGAPRVEIAVGDLTDASKRLQLVDAAKRHLGGLDHLVLNHADYTPRSWVGSAQNLTDLERQLDANFLSYVEVASHALPLLKTSSGAIGVVSSVAAKVPVPLLAGYSAAKAAQQSFFAALRQELKRDHSAVSVTTFLLGPVSTDKFVDIVNRHFPSVNTYYAATPAETATRVIQGICNREGEVLYPRFAWFQYIFHMLVPEIHEYNLNYVTKNSIVNY